jgi:phosphoribosyl 1,2-cyclic phosphate phosphodiesterase
MRLTFLGTGTSTGVPTLGCQCRVCQSEDPRDKRTRPSVLLEYDGRVVMIDAGPDFRQQALREKITRLDAVVFTHSHADHIFGLDDVRPYYFRQQQPIPIYADRHSLENIRRTFSYIFEGSYPFGGVAKLSPHEIHGPFELWGLDLIPVPLLHGNLSMLGFRFRDTAYLTDFSVIPASSDALLQGLDVLILDALRPHPHPTHSTIQNSLSLVERFKPRRAFFTHMAHDVGHAEVEATFPPYVRLSYDGLKLEV